MYYTLYGDGISDDTLAIQEMLDSGLSLVELPVPKKHYCISKTLILHSNQTLRLGRTTTIKLLPHSDCYMITNEENACDIAVEGGIWDYNNKFQRGNPIKDGSIREACGTHKDRNPDTVVSYTDAYRGTVLHFYKAERLTVRNLTVKDPVTYCVEMAYITYFAVENIFFDQNLGNPTAENMDGIHIDGGCRYGTIRNVQGTCYDDVVALNADDGCDGTIRDIVVDGILGCDCLRGVRLLSTKSLVENISISNVSGTYYQNCIGITYFYPRSGVRGKMSHISIRNVFGKNAPRRPEYNKGDNSYYSFSFIWIDGDLDIDFLTIDNVCRNEEISGVETLKVCKDCHIERLSLSNMLQQNMTGKPVTMFTNEGIIDKLFMYNIDPGNDVRFDNRGTVGAVKEILL